MRYLARVIAILAVFVLLGCESLQQPVTCNSSLDCPGEQVCISGECLPSVLADCSDEDGDGVCDDYDICPNGDDSSDLDSDGNPDDCDPCPFDYPNDSDGDGVCESSDKCAAGDDNVDTDADGVADACDVCEGFADGADSDEDGIPDGCDVCPQSTSGDSDGDGMCDEQDLCEGFDDSVDTDSDGNPDGCDPCPDEFPDDTDGDGVCNSVDACQGFSDLEDTDGDGVADGCDSCPLDALDDSDGDTVCDSDDKCPGENDLMGSDSDGDTVPDICDTCSTGDDLIDSDSDGYPNACDKCPFDPYNDSDLDDVCDSDDICLNGDDNIDTDGDAIPDACDACPLDINDDSDGDGRCDSDDICVGDDLTGDSDSDGTCNNLDDDDDNDNCLDVNDSAPTVFSSDADGDGLGLDCDACVGQNDTGDTDGDGTCNDQDGDDDNDGCGDNDDPAPLVFSPDSDGDGDANDCDICPQSNPNDSDGDGICESQDVCTGQDSSGDTDGDGTCNNLDLDDDNDGCPDTIDAASQLASTDTDGDGIAEDCDACLGVDSSGDNDNDDFCNDVDEDDDNDGCDDDEDLNPLSASSDTDGDGVAEDCDLCSGNDATGDTDNDGTCNNLDGDDDDDNCVDSLDPNPLTFQGDLDNDGTPDDCDDGYTVFAEDFESGATNWNAVIDGNEQPLTWAASTERASEGNTAWRLSYPPTVSNDAIPSGTALLSRSSVTLPQVASNQTLTLSYRQFFDFDREDETTCLAGQPVLSGTNGDGGVVVVNVAGSEVILTPERGYSEQLADIFSVIGATGSCQDHPDTSIFGGRSRRFSVDAFDYVKVDLSAYAGQSVNVGLKGIWDCGNCYWSTGEDAEGWYIDDVELVRTTCGNNVVELGEACDDGNNQDGDGCSSDCSTRPVLPWLGSDDGSLVSDKQCPAGSLGVGFSTDYTGNRLEDVCLVCRTVGDSGLGSTSYIPMTGNQCQIQSEIRCDVAVDGTLQDSVAILTRVWFDDVGAASGLALGCQSLSDVGTDWGTHTIVGGAQTGSVVSQSDHCNGDQVLGGFSTTSSAGLITGFQFTCTGACSDGQSADECGVCGGSGAPTWYQDTDGDGEGVDSVTLTACTQPVGYASVAGDPQPDCATNNEDVCGVCAGSGEQTFYADTDGDGQGDASDSVTACTAPSGYVSNGTDPQPDCTTNDEDECGVCAGPGLITWYLDQDSDNLGDPDSATTESCFQPSGYVSNNNDTQPTCGTNNEDACGVCAGPGPATWYEDDDGDGLGDPASTQSACSQPGGYVANNTDPCPLDNPDDRDGDGICNSDDPDQDGDGCANGLDPAPTVAAAQYTYEDDIEPMLLSAPYSCDGCHSSDASWNGFLNLSNGVGYGELMGGGSGDNSVCAGTSYSERVTPGNPSNSFFYRKVVGSQDCGDQMPQGCSDSGCVSPADLAEIYMWICQGAPEN